MKKILLLLLLIPSLVYAETAVIGSGIKQVGTVLSEADDITKVVFSNLSVIGCSNCGSSSLQEVYDGGATITTDATNDEVIIKYGGDNGLIQEWQKSDGTAIFGMYTSGPVFLQNIAMFQDQKSSGSFGGTCTSGSYITRDLNTTVISASFANLTTNNRIEIQPGTYFIDAIAPAYVVDAHKAKFVNSTGPVDIIVGTSADAFTSQTRSRMIGRFTLASPTFTEILHRCQTTRATNGFGQASSFGETEKYTTVILRKED